MKTFHVGKNLEVGAALVPDFQRTRALVEPFLDALAIGPDSFRQLLLHARYVRAVMRKSRLREWSDCSKWATEAVFERVRARSFPDAPGRLDSCFFYDDREKSMALFAADYLEPGDDEGVFLYEIDLDEDEPRRFDMSIYDEAYAAIEERSDLDGALAAAARYWSGERRGKPVLEIVSRRRAVVASKVDIPRAPADASADAGPAAGGPA